MFIFADLFGDDVARPLQRLVHGAHFVRQKTFGFLLRIAVRAQQQALCERFESFFACHLCTSAAFGFEGQIDIFDFRRIPTSRDARSQFVGQRALCLDGFEHKSLAMLQFVELTMLFGHGGYGHFVQTARRFFAVTGNKRYRGALVEEGDGLFYLFFAEVQPLSDELNGRHGARFWGYTT